MSSLLFSTLSAATGQDVEMNGVYVWDNVKIGDNCRITSSILCELVELKADVVVNSGCVFATGVISNHISGWTCGITVVGHRW